LLSFLTASFSTLLLLLLWTSCFHITWDWLTLTDWGFYWLFSFYNFGRTA
jgi:hypothetical protein